MTVYKQFAIVFFMHISELSIKEREALAEKAKTKAVYLYQIGKGVRSPSVKLAKRLMDADPRLTWDSIYGRAPDTVAEQEKAA